MIARPPTTEHASLPSATSGQGPLSFVGWMPLLFGVAYLPAAHLTTTMLVQMGFALPWAALCVGLLFPALLLPTLPTTSRRTLVRSAGWLRGLFAFLPTTAAALILMMALMAEDLSIQAFATVAVTALCAFFCSLLLAFDTGTLDG